MLPRFLLRHRQPIVLLLHLLLIPIGYFCAFALRFELSIPREYIDLAGVTLISLVPLRLLSFALFGLYHGWWRHVGMQDMVDLTKAITLSSALFLGTLFLTQQLEGFPRSILILDWIIAIFIFAGIRFSVRGLREARTGWSGTERRGTPALVIGAGEAAERLLRQVRQGGVGIRPVGLVDDNPNKRGMRLHGVPVVGTTEDLGELVQRTQVRLLVIAMPSATRDEMKQVVSRCIQTDVEFKIVPPLQELIDGHARVSQLRHVQVEDLLGRDSVELDNSGIRRDLEGRVVLVTGGAGSIGSELARQIASFGPARLIVLDQSESALYFVDLELRKTHPDLALVPLVADITDPMRLERIFAEYRPDYVFHAAAYKHVPLMEFNPTEAARNNVLGTLNVAQAAAAYQAERFVLISTDKAVCPSSVMGATKRVAERLALGWPALRASKTDFRAVRFGNVLGSDGSVIPVFRKQLAEGGPITVTHPDVTRYFMTIPEAVQLVLQAAALPEVAGRIAMLEMGEPVRIVELAENLVRLSGLEPYKDIPIIFTGLRPGEKLREELMSDVEETIPTAVEKVRVVQTDEMEGEAIERGIDRLAAAVALGDSAGLLAELCALVPECTTPLRANLADAIRRDLPETDMTVAESGARPGN